MSSRSKRQSSKSTAPSTSQNVVDLTASTTASTSTTASSSKLDVDEFFNQYFAPSEEQVANMEGICHFAETFFKIDPMEDTRILVFLWKMIEGRASMSMHYSSSSMKKSSSMSSKTAVKPSVADSSSSASPTMQPGHLTKEQFQKGCLNLGLDSEASLRKLLPTLDTGFLEKADFRDFFKVRKAK